MDVSIIIVTYNTRQMTSDCIDSIISNTSGIEYEIILVDNASQDGSKEFFSNDNRIKYIYNDANFGFGKANNKGLEEATGRKILFLNSDTRILNNAIKILSDFLDSNPQAGACGGNLYDSEGKPGFSFERYFPSPHTEINCLFRNLPDRIIYGKNLNFNYSKKPMKVAYITGADLMMKHEVINKIGGFNPQFFLFYEETELCFRVHKMGYFIFSIPKAKIIHLVGESSMKINRMQHLEKSRKIFYQLCYSPFLLNFANAIRLVTYYSKMLFSSKEVREKWKAKRKIFIS